MSGIGYRWEAEWAAAEAIAAEERAARQGDAAARAGRTSPRYAAMLAETGRSGMRYGAVGHTVTRESGDDCQCLECVAGRMVAAAEAAEVTAAVEWPEVGYAGRMAAEAWAVFHPVAYGPWDALEASYAALGEAATYSASVSASDVVRAGMRLYDPSNVERRGRWTRDRMRPGRPYASRRGADNRLTWDVTPCEVYAADGTHLRTIVEVLDTLGRKAGTKGGRKATWADPKARNRAKAAAYRERQRAAREAAARGAEATDYRDA